MDRIESQLDLDEVASKNQEMSLTAVVDLSLPASAELPVDPSPPLKVGAPRSLGFLVGALAGGNLASSALRMVGGLLQARFVAPSVLGLFNGIGLIQGYTRFLQMGILNGLNRELPYYFGKGDHQRVKELASAAQAWAIALGVTVALALNGVAAWYLAHGQWWIAAGWATNAVTVFIFFYGTMYLQATYRTAHDFARLSLVNVVQNAAAVALIVLIVLMNFYGMCLRAIISAIAGLAMLYYWRPICVRPAWNLRHLKHLLIIGLPIFGVGELYQFWQTLEGTLVLQQLGRHGMGLYAMVVVVSTTLEMLPMAVSQVLYPRMAEQYGRTGHLGGLLRMSISPMLATAAGMVPLIVAGWWLAEPLTRWLVPNYLEAVPAMQWSLLPPLAISAAPIHNVYNVVRRQDLYIVAIVLGMATYLGSLMWLARNGITLVAFPQAMLVGRSVFVVVGYAMFVPLLVRAKDAGRCERHAVDE